MTSRPLRRRGPVSSFARVSLVTVVVLHGFVACGGDEASSAPPSVSAGSGGGGAAGTGAIAGAGGKAGSASGAAGSAGAGSTSGSAGAAGVAGAGQAGAAGTAGAAGGAAGSGGGAAGAAGSGGCKVDADCPATLSTQPANCAKAKCNNGTCGFVAGDADGDGHGAARCKSNDGTQIVTLGDDCDDANKDISPGGWDGPAGDGKPNHCNDGIDQDCSGLDDDQKLANGGTCTCTPGDVEPCSQTSAGKTVTFPVLEQGKPLLPCVLGSRTCLAGGKWGACTDLREPDPETCDNVDNDCNGVIDDNAADKPTWVWDADGDLHGAPDCPTVQACPSSAPTAPPTGCKSADCDKVKCPTAQWRSTLFFQADDCDDLVTARYPGNIERCDQLDNDCDTVVDEGPDGKAGSICACNEADPPIACFSGAQGLKLEAPAICRKGTAACKNGTVGECTGQVLPSVELCNEVDDDCDGEVDEGFGTLDASKKPVPCDVDGSPTGACFQGGHLTCAPSGVSTVCTTNDPANLKQSFWHPNPSPPPSSSPDWGCDGLPEFQPFRNGAPLGPQLYQPLTRYFTRSSAQCTDVAIRNLCANVPSNECKTGNAIVFVDCVDDGNNGPVCGQKVKTMGCSYQDPEPGTPEKCYGIGTPGEATIYCR